MTHGHITSGGQKMSKSIGNVINPKEVLDELENKNLCAKDIEGNSLAGDALRFILLHEIPTLGDGDITMEQIKNIYNAHLANGLGNTVSRIMKIAEENNNDLIDFRINNNFINPYDSYEIHNTHHDVFHTNKEK
ncbi:MAG: class I tRNA ligase family protein, partial [Candidatus Pacebacteria bacterium]|nr:class I tRNA ligase family protein [Candidatus Paceibacterota bacterium]